MKSYILFLSIGLLFFSISSAQQDSNKTIYTYVEQMPEFPGGTDQIGTYLGDKISYPEIALDNNIEGRVLVRFVINQDGKVSDVQVIKHVYPSIDSEVLRVINNMPNWKPGIQGHDANGNPKYVKVYFTLPVAFKTDDKSEQIYLDTANAIFSGPRSMYYNSFPEFSRNLENMLYINDKTIGIGTVKVLVTIDEKGKLKNPRILKSTFNEMGKMALNLITKNWTSYNNINKWKPAIHNNKPEVCDLILTVHFNDRIE